MKLTCIFDLQGALLDKSGKPLTSIKRLTEVLELYGVSALLYTINEPWSLNQLATKPNLAAVFKNIYLVNKKTIDDIVWLKPSMVSNTLVIGDGRDSELAFAKSLKIPQLDVTLSELDLVEALEARFQEFYYGK